MSGTTPLLSVIVPAYQGEGLLPDTLGALARSDLPRDRWELIVVDDSSTDDTGATAAAGGRTAVVTLAGGPRGPGHARNRGAEVSRGAWVVFVDADVRVHADTLRRFAEAIAEDPRAGAIFGAYDDAPPGPRGALGVPESAPSLRAPAERRRGGDLLGGVRGGAAQRLHGRRGVRRGALSPSADRGHRPRVPVA